MSQKPTETLRVLSFLPGGFPVKFPRVVHLEKEEDTGYHTGMLQLWDSNYPLPSTECKDA